MALEYSQGKPNSRHRFSNNSSVSEIATLHVCLLNTIAFMAGKGILISLSFSKGPGTCSEAMSGINWDETAERTACEPANQPARTLVTPLFSALLFLFLHRLPTFVDSFK